MVVGSIRMGKARTKAEITGMDFHTRFDLFSEHLAQYVANGGYRSLDTFLAPPVHVYYLRRMEDSLGLPLTDYPVSLRRG